MLYPVAEYGVDNAIFIPAKRERHDQGPLRHRQALANISFEIDQLGNPVELIDGLVKHGRIPLGHCSGLR